MATQQQNEIAKKLEPLTNYIVEMLLAGTLKKNAIKNLTNRGLNIEPATMIVEHAERIANDFTHYKIK